MDRTAEFEQERPRLTRIAARILGDPAEAEDVVQRSWLRLERADEAAIGNLPGWLTTVVTRLCLDRLKAAVPEPRDADDAPVPDLDPADEVALADTVGIALQVLLDQLSPGERVAFVLHDSFGIDFTTVAEVLDCTPAAARKLASRARARIAQPRAEERRADRVVVDAFLSAARNGEFARLLELLAPDVVVVGDPVSVAVGTPERIAGREAVAGFFNGAAASALPVFVGDRPGAAWFDRGTARVAFDFTVRDGRVAHIEFRAAPDVLDSLRRRRDGGPHPVESPGRHTST